MRTAVGLLCLSLSLLTDKVPQGEGAIDRPLKHHSAGGGVTWLLLLLMLLSLLGTCIHPPSQNTPERRDVGGAGCGVHPTTRSWRVGEVAEAVPALRHQADLSEVGSREGGTGAGTLHWEPSFQRGGGRRRRGRKKVDVGRGTRERASLVRLRAEDYDMDKPPLRQSKLIFQVVDVTAGGELVLESGNKSNIKE